MNSTFRSMLFGVLLVPAMVVAHGMPGHHGPVDVRPHGPGDGPGRVDRPALPEPRDPVCILDCRQELRECLVSVSEKARACREECAPLMEEARAACEADPESDACAEARAAARDCARGCREDVRGARRECLQSARECMGNCDVIVLDRECVRSCRGELAECLSAAHDQYRVCRKDCGDLVRALHEACADRWGSDDCRDAREATRLCLAPCRWAFSGDWRACLAELRDCLATCQLTDTLPPEADTGAD